MKPVHLKLILVILSILFVLSGCQGGKPIPTLPPVTGTAVQVAYWPTQGWKSSTAEAQGMDPARLNQALDKVKAQSPDLDSLLVIRNGYIVSENYYHAYNQATRHTLYSVTKSFTSTLLGIAIDRGYIDSVRHRVLDYFPKLSLENRDAQKEAMTLEDLLSMASGLNWNEGDPTYQAMYISDNWTAFVLDYPMHTQPGKEFNYCSGCSHVLSAVIQQTSKPAGPAFADQALFKPLGITDYTWDTDPTGVPIGGWGLELTPRDMAKLGYLFLNQGQWDGQQIVSADWVKTATQSHIHTGSQAIDYGYQWWINTALGTFSARGRYGQTIYVAPRENLIVVITANLDKDQPVYQLIENDILPAAKSK